MEALMKIFSGYSNYAIAILALIILVALLFLFFSRKKRKKEESENKKSLFDFLFEGVEGDIEDKTDKELVPIYKLNYKRMWIFWMTGYVVYSLIMFVVLKYYEVKVPTNIIGLSVLFHFIISWFNVVKEDKRGALYFLRKPISIVERGIQPVPAFICKLIQVPRKIFTNELPVDESLIYRPLPGEPDFVPPELLKKGYRTPLRVTFKGDDKAPNDPLRQRVTVEIPGLVIWRIRDAIKFLSVIGSIEEAREVMGNLYITLITVDLPRVTLGDFYERKNSFDKKIEDKLETLTDAWGIEIVSAKIKDPGQSRNLNTKIQSMAESVAEMVAAKNRGKGKGEEEEGILAGRTRGYKNMAEETKLDIKDVVASETARKATENVDNFTAVGSGGIGDLLSLVAASKGIFQTKDKKTDEKKEEGKEKGGKK